MKTESILDVTLPSVILLGDQSKAQFKHRISAVSNSIQHEFNSIEVRYLNQLNSTGELNWKPLQHYAAEVQLSFKYRISAFSTYSSWY